MSSVRGKFIFAVALTSLRDYHESLLIRSSNGGESLTQTTLNTELYRFGIITVLTGIPVETTPQIYTAKYEFPVKTTTNIKLWREYGMASALVNPKLCWDGVDRILICLHINTDVSRVYRETKRFTITKTSIALSSSTKLLEIG